MSGQFRTLGMFLSSDGSEYTLLWFLGFTFSSTIAVVDVASVWNKVVADRRQQKKYFVCRFSLCLHNCSALCWAEPFFCHLPCLDVRKRLIEVFFTNWCHVLWLNKHRWILAKLSFVFQLLRTDGTCVHCGSSSQSVAELELNKLAKLGDAKAISNLKLSITDWLTDPLTDRVRRCWI